MSLALDGSDGKIFIKMLSILRAQKVMYYLSEMHGWLSKKIYLDNVRIRMLLIIFWQVFLEFESSKVVVFKSYDIRSIL